MRGLKSALRKELIARRKAMDPNEKRKADADIFEQIKPYLDKAETVFTYASSKIEVDTRRIIEYCLQNNIPIALPVSGDTMLDFYFINSEDQLKKGRFGIDEPPRNRKAEPSRGCLCIVPALCADGNGFRLGYGRGYYDRFLAYFTGRSVTICYNRFKQDVPKEEHDIKTDVTIFDRLP